MDSTTQECAPQLDTTAVEYLQLDITATGMHTPKPALVNAHCWTKLNEEELTVQRERCTVWAQSILWCTVEL